jgi:tRNA nucleotidyltransferase (CCA-adding enzyme)
MKPFLKRTLLEIKPSSKEEGVVEKVFQEVSSEIKKTLPAAELFLGGSAAKGTRLKDNKELDLFLKFPSRTKSISSEALKALKIFSPQVVKGSRDYYSFSYRGFNCEVIPVYEIRKAGDAQNIMDYSPLHVDYVKKNLKKPDEAVLLKHFCKQNGLYGAESYRKGFSGYALELLVIHFKTFEKVVENAKNWGERAVINLTRKKYSLTKSQRTSLIIYDPVQPSRNASNALSHENFKKFVQLCSDYSKKPSKKFFTDKNSLENFKKKKKKNEVFYPKRFAVKGKKDVFLSKLYRKLDRVSSELSRQGFKNSFKLIPEESAFFFIIVERIPGKVVHKGPGTSMKEHCKKFRSKWEAQGLKVRTKDGKLFVVLERSVTEGKVALKKLVSSYGL